MISFIYPFASFIFSLFSFLNSRTDELEADREILFEFLVILSSSCPTPPTPLANPPPIPTLTSN